MAVSLYGLYDRFARQVVSLAVLADEQEEWRPSQFALGLWGCTMQFTYPVVKLLDYRAQPGELEASANPFATVALAHLAAQDTRGDMERRQQVKLALTRTLYERGYSREQVLDLYRFIDWLLELPEEQEERVWQEIRAYEEERQMPYISTAERIGERIGHERGRAEGREEGRAEGRAEGHAEGRAEGRVEALLVLLRERFGAVPDPVAARIQAIADPAALDALLVRSVHVERLDELFA